MPPKKTAPGVGWEAGLEPPEGWGCSWGNGAEGVILAVETGIGQFWRPAAEKRVPAGGRGRSQAAKRWAPGQISDVLPHDPNN